MVTWSAQHFAVAQLVPNKPQLDLETAVNEVKRTTHRLLQEWDGVWGDCLREMKEPHERLQRTRPGAEEEADRRILEEEGARKGHGREVERRNREEEAVSREREARRRLHHKERGDMDWAAAEEQRTREWNARQREEEQQRLAATERERRQQAEAAGAGRNHGKYVGPGATTGRSRGIVDTPAARARGWPNHGPLQPFPAGTGKGEQSGQEPTNTAGATSRPSTPPGQRIPTWWEVRQAGTEGKG